MGVYEQLRIETAGDERVTLVKDAALVPGDMGEDADYTVVGTGIVWITVGTYQVMINAQTDNVYVAVQRYGEPDEDLVDFDGDYDDVVDEMPHSDLMSLSRKIAAAYAAAKGDQ